MAVSVRAYFVLWLAFFISKFQLFGINVNHIVELCLAFVLLHIPSFYIFTWNS